MVAAARVSTMVSAAGTAASQVVAVLPLDYSAKLATGRSAGKVEVDHLLEVAAVDVE